jgi:hypothetical protein
VRAFHDVWQEYSRAMVDPILKHELLTKQQLLHCVEIDNVQSKIPAVTRFGMFDENS